jgi:DNA repair protein RadC
MANPIPETVRQCGGATIGLADIQGDRAARAGDRPLRPYCWGNIMTEANMIDLFKVAEVELIYKSNYSPYRPKIGSTADAYEILRSTWDMNKIELVEQFKIILMDHSTSCLGVAEISTGGIAYCVADPKIVFATALKARATRIILAHNHPTGNLMESAADIAITNRLCTAGQLLDIQVTDHLIVCANGYRSFADEGLIP